MSLDCYASASHYAEHLAPIAAAIPGARMLCTTGPVLNAAMDAMMRLPGDHNGKIHRAEMPDYNASTPILVASYHDLQRCPDSRRVAMLEHGAGQTYLDAPTSPYYPGGEGHDRCSLILSPGPHSARLWRTAYPTIPVVELHGTPRLDPWVQRYLFDAEYHAQVYEQALQRATGPVNPRDASQPHPPPMPQKTPPGPARGTVGTGHVRARVAASFHWECNVAPETRATWPYWQHAIAGLAKEHELIGHAHPRTWDSLQMWYQREGITSTASFADLLDRSGGGLYLCDNSSTMYEWAGLGWPVLCLDDLRIYRHQIEHGLRFWSHPPGPSCTDPWGLAEQVWTLIEEPGSHEEAERLRAAACMEAYGLERFDGQATARAITAIEEHLL